MGNIKQDSVMILHDLIKDKNGIDNTYGSIQPAAILESAQSYGCMQTSLIPKVKGCVQIIQGYMGSIREFL